MTYLHDLFQKLFLIAAQHKQTNVLFCFGWKIN